MIQIAICDDDICAATNIKEECKKILNGRKDIKYLLMNSPEKILTIIKTQEIDILLLDIEMPKYDGFTIAEYLNRYNKKTIIIFVTNKDMYVYESFKYNPHRFIRKSYLNEMEEALTSAIELIDSSQEKFLVEASSKLKYEVNTNDIVYFESIHNNVKIVTIKGTNYFRSTLKNVEEKLNKNGFIRIYSSIIINLKYLYYIDKKSMIVEMLYNNNIERLPYSRSCQKRLYEAYKLFLR